MYKCVVCKSGLKEHFSFREDEYFCPKCKLVYFFEKKEYSKHCSEAF